MKTALQVLADYLSTNIDDLEVMSADNRTFETNGATYIVDGNEVFNCEFWDCNCKHSYIHHVNDKSCKLCHAEGLPDVRSEARTIAALKRHGLLPKDDLVDAIPCSGDLNCNCPACIDIMSQLGEL